MDHERYILNWTEEVLGIKKILTTQSPLQRAEKIIELYMLTANHSQRLEEEFRDYLEANFWIVVQTKAIDKLMEISDEFDDIILGRIFPEADDSEKFALKEQFVEA